MDSSDGLSSLEEEKVSLSPKFNNKWLQTFSPWIDKDSNTGKPYCKVCKCTISCNIGHLKRHTETSKHKMNFSLATSKKFKASPKTTSTNDIKIESKPKRQACKTNTKNQKANGTETNSGEMEDFQFVTTNQNKNHRSDSIDSEKIEDKRTLLKKIQKDRLDLFDSYDNVFSRRNRSATAMHETTPESRREKDHVDLFFESVILSVKNLSPKLIAEAKLRVSQMIGELELREITANESCGSKMTSNEADVSSVSSYYINHPVVYVSSQEQESHTQGYVSQS